MPQDDASLQPGWETTLSYFFPKGKTHIVLQMVLYARTSNKQTNRKISFLLERNLVETTLFKNNSVLALVYILS